MVVEPYIKASLFGGGKKMNLQFQHFCVGKPLRVYEVSKVCVVSKAKSGQTFLGNSFEGLFQSYD